VALRNPAAGRCVAANPEEIISWAYARVIARHGAAGSEVPFGQLVAEVRAEASAELSRRIAKNLRRIARAAARIRGASEVLAYMQQSAAGRAAAPEHEFTDLDPDAFALVLAARQPPARVNGHALHGAAPGPPRWHPESHRDTEDD
jgi:hypothetical protein